ncbi:tetratricopeptide repeat protein [Pendulispora rubella]|uniref:Tetratricopeptide repeat protein n=1 Tax=Pendulispora rubella TaxID=2741070 RepID=A0ABZ2KYI0_9BACT
MRSHGRAKMVAFGPTMQVQRLLAVSVAACAFLGSSRAFAQGVEQEADRLFNEGNRLMASGAYREACPKLERSQELDPGVGTQFNLANCYEMIERPARALSLFREVERIARAAGKTERAEAAHQRAASLASRTPQLRFITSEPLEWSLDGERLRNISNIPQAVFVDPGAHHVVASAPGKRPWSSTVNITHEMRLVEVTAPSLASDAAPPAHEPRRPTSSWPVQRTVALVFAGAGVVGLGVGAYFGLSSRADHDAAEGLCPNRDACSSREGVSKWDDATSKGTASTLAFAAGGAALVAGGILWFTAPVRVVPNVTPTHAGVVVAGSL